jgi:hypothetical protein
MDYFAKSPWEPKPFGEVLRNRIGGAFFADFVNLVLSLGGYMRFSVETIKADVARDVRLWDQQLLTIMETVGRLVDRFAFALLERPDAKSAVAEAFDTVPTSLLTAMADRLANDRNHSGEWRWPPGGPPLTTPFAAAPSRSAGPAETAALEILVKWLQERGCEVQSRIPE